MPAYDDQVGHDEESIPLLPDDDSLRLIHIEQSESQIGPENPAQDRLEAEEAIQLRIPGPLTPLPLRSVAILMLLRATASIALQIIYPFVNQMVLEVGIVDNPEEVGFYSGLIESIFSCLSLVTVMPISYLMDYVGRKPIILCGTLGMAISISSFGMSKTFPAMIMTRCIGGASGGVWAATKTITAEYTDKTNQVKAFQLLTIAYRISQTLILPLGGFLAHPERNFSIFQTKFWIENPFALPCFVASAITVISVTLGYFFLEETLKSKGGQSANIHHEIDTHPTASLKEILTPQIVGLLLNNTAMSLVSNGLFALFPLFAFTPVSSGGLGLSEAAIGLRMSARSFIHIGLLLLYSNLERYFKGTFRLYRIITFTLPVTVCCMPALNILARTVGANSFQVNFATGIFFIIWAFCGLAWTNTIILITDCSPSERELSRINGLSQVAISLSEVIAPATATSLFAYSIKNHLFGGQLIWIVLFLIACGTAVHSLTLKETVNKWRTKTT